jgi:ComF family protein
VGIWSRALVDAADPVVAALLDPRCVACDARLDRPSRGPVCAACWAQVQPMHPPVCHTCGVSLHSWRTVQPDGDRCVACRRRGTAVDLARAGGIYEGTLRGIVHALKYDGRQSLARPLADLMRAAGAEVLDGADSVVPVPLHAWRRLGRGFNQASLLAAHLGLPMVQALHRTRATAAQATLGAAGRRRNVRGAFRPSRFLGRRGVGTLHDAIVVLVDDVSTTGATLDECARTLKAMGVREVRALVAARAPYPSSIRPARAPHRSSAATST